MNPVIGYLIERPGLLAGMLPVFLLAFIGAIQYWRQGRSAGTRGGGTSLPEAGGLSPADSHPYYRSLETEEAPPVSRRTDGVLSRIGCWAVDYFATHLALVGVLGAVAFGGIALTTVLSRMKFVSVWSILAGIVLFLAYLAFVGVVILVVNGISEQALRRMGESRLPAKEEKLTMASDVAFLEEAVSDVGLWSWWTAELPETVQIEFTGTLLWNPPLREGGPPSGQVALRFLNPSFFGFLTRRNHDSSLPHDWPERMRNDQMQPFNLSPEDLTLSDAERLMTMVSEAGHVETLVGDVGSLVAVASEAAFCGFWAGPVGLVVVAAGMKIFGCAGELSLAEAEAANLRWWEYWREYWQSKDSGHPMPKDYACEVTIPLG